MGYGFLCFTVMISFADQIIPLLFGEGHEISIYYTRYLFIIMIPYPIVLLQAGYLISKGYESVDLQGNIIVLIMTFIFSLAGLYISHGVLSVIISLCLSFIVFQLYQDYIFHKIKDHIKKQTRVDLCFYDFNTTYLLLSESIVQQQYFVSCFLGHSNFCIHQGKKISV